MKSITSLSLAALLACSQGAALAQTALASAPAAVYGPGVGLDAARRAGAPAAAEAARNGWPLSIAIVDTAGQLVHFEKMDSSGGATIQVAIDKARSSALFRRPTNAFQDSLASGNTFILGLTGAVPREGGSPLVADGKVIGAIGVSGGTGAQDGAVAKAAADQIK